MARKVMTAATKQSTTRPLAAGARQLAPMHVSIRVPWHDSGWVGATCADPGRNRACLILPRIAAEKSEAETPLVRWDTKTKLPPCVAERASFMAPFEFIRKAKHPYAEFSDQHRHFKETPFPHPAYSAAAVPFRWMRRPNVVDDERTGAHGLAARYRLGFDAKIEPTLDGFSSQWVQHRKNQALLLDTFFSAVVKDHSLCFFYAKRSPLTDDSRRVIVGVGRVLNIGEPVDYEYSRNRAPSDLEGMLWERNIFHSIRPGFADGFLLPYHQLLEECSQDAEDDALKVCIAFAPDDHWEAFSFATEHVPQDAAIASLLACSNALRKIEERVAGPWKQVQKWISARLGEVWSLRGAYPGFAAALAALQVPNPTLLAHEVDLEAHRRDQRPFNPWALFNEVLAKPRSMAGAALAEIGPGHKNMWDSLPPERRALVELLSRFALTEAQATRWYQIDQRRKLGITLSDDEILKNPYLLFEYDRSRIDPIHLRTIDRGLLPDELIRKDFPMPSPSALSDAADIRRLRAVACEVLSRSADEDGHTLLPVEWINDHVSACELETPCSLSIDYLRAAKMKLAPLIHVVPGSDGGEALQLHEMHLAKDIIERRVNGRVKTATRFSATHSWETAVNSVLEQTSGEPMQSEARAREEKAAALKEIHSSPLSVLVGGAGTGKTTLLKALCNLSDVGTVLLLAPTGKARVRLEAGTGRPGQGQTLAQFLLKQKRYDPDTGRYFPTGANPRANSWKTVIVDECSMLTELQLAALFDALEGVERLILVGDPRQLPPIGEGRPFADIVNRLMLRDAAGNPVDRFPMVGRSYAELTVSCRQPAKGATGGREDLRFASWFAGRGVDPSSDDLWHLEGYDSPHLRFVRWEDHADLSTKLDEEIRRELRSRGFSADEEGFARSLGGVLRRDEIRFVLGESASFSDTWQILTPIRRGDAGIEALNRLAKVKFRSKAMHAALASRDRTIPRPIGPQAIVYGDKVISNENGRREDARTWWPDLEYRYIPNGELGVVVGKIGKNTKELQVAFQPRPDEPMRYRANDFESGAPLDLAYALTIHKSQGSEFKTTFVVLPNPCAILSRELLYTALTRQQDKVIVLHQGPLAHFREFAEDHASAIARRLTNLFAPPRLVPVEVASRAGVIKRVFLEEKLIHRAPDGTRVRSKGELVIAILLEQHLKGKLTWIYEQPKAFPDGKERWPDFTIRDEDTGRVFYWEHSGFMHDEEYRRKWRAKLQGYRDMNIVPYEEGVGGRGILIFTEDDAKGGLDAEKVDRIIRNVILGS